MRKLSVMVERKNLTSVERALNQFAIIKDANDMEKQRMHFVDPVLISEGVILEKAIEYSSLFN